MSRTHHSSFSGFFRKVLKRANPDEPGATNANRSSDPQNGGATTSDQGNNTAGVSSSHHRNAHSEQLSEQSEQSLSTTKEPLNNERVHPDSSAKSLAGSAYSNPSIAVDSIEETPSSTHVTIDNTRLDSPPAPGSTFSRNFADSASVRTIASSSRRRRSLDTNASTRAIAESVFSADSDHTWDPSKQ